MFAQVGNIWGQDLPSKIQLKVAYGDIPVHGGGRQIIDVFSRHKGEFENVAFLIPTNMDLSSNYLLYLLRCGSAFSYAIFAANILLLWLILIFLVNSLGKSVK